MNIIIPLGGKGERFRNKGYRAPKPLINIFDKCMIDYVLDNLSIQESDKVFIIFNKYLEEYNFHGHINANYPFITLIKIDDTRGASETLYRGIKIILDNYDHNRKTMVLDCDTFYTEDILDIFRGCNENTVFYRKNYDIQAMYSYIELNSENDITSIKEKEKISDNANTGAYAFTDINVLHQYCKHVLDNNISFKSEMYTSCVISEMIKQDIKFKGFELKEELVYSLGTPHEVDQFVNTRFAFLFDLDGTLVITDKIYYDVWYEILLNYNIFLDENMFKKYIQGNNDLYVKNNLLRNVSITVPELSAMKDDLFLKNKSKIIVIDGVYDLLLKIKTQGHKICIVTNCNKRVSTEIARMTGIDKYIDFIISNNDCVNGKPNCEPYRKAIERYNISNDRCFIFEDSKSGLISGKGVCPKLLIGIETNYDKSTLTNNGAHTTIKNYLDLDLKNLLLHQTDYISYLKNIIKQHSNLSDIIDITIDGNKLKGGFIADVISFNTITRHGEYSQILKYEVDNDNNLSVMSRQIELYKREYYFYTNISPYVNVKIPKFYHLIANENNDVFGIVLENLFKKGFKLNLNLNIESIDISLKIVDRMALLHSKFWNADLKYKFPELKANNDKIFMPFLHEFIKSRYDIFKQKWHNVLNDFQKQKCDEIYDNFDKIQAGIANNDNLTLIHGDIKSPNIFYDTENNEPYFIDWQHCAIGSGCQDLIFFVIESFDIENTIRIFNLLKEYYYTKLLEYGVKYSYGKYEHDLYCAICYIPFFTSVWFGSTKQDELIDKNFPYFLITKLFNLIEYVSSSGLSGNK